MQFDNTQGTHVTGQLRFRNTQVELIGGNVYALSYFNMSLGGGPMLGGGGSVTGQSGNVRKGPLAAGQDFLGTPINYFYDANWFGTDAFAFGTARIGTLQPSNGYGLLGCVVPYLTAITKSYAGATCAGAGYDGWQVLSFAFDFRDAGDAQKVSPSSLTLDPGFLAISGPSYTLLPEPSAWAMMVVGLAALSIVARRRRTHS
jgi:hypothetical protein